MAKYDYVHACKLADKEFPDALLDALLKEHKSGAGIAVMGAFPDYLGTFHQLVSPSTKDVQELLAGHKDKCCVLSFVRGPDKMEEKQLQPYVGLFDTDGNTTLAGFLSGNFESKAKAGGDSAELQVWTRLVVPQILRTAKNHEDDAAETYTDMASDPATAELMKMFYDKVGNITVVTNEGLITWGEGRTDFDFGWTTDACGYAEATKVNAEPAKPADKSSGKLSGFGKSHKPEGLSETQKTHSSQVSLPTPKDAPGITPADEEWIFSCPPSAWTKDQKRKWYLEHNIYIDGKVLNVGAGIVPEGYKNCPKVRIKKSQITAPASAPIKSLQEIPKDKIVTNSGPAVTTELVPMIPPAEKRWLAEYFQKKGHVQGTLSEGKSIIDPKRIEKLEEDWPAFVEAAGLDKTIQTIFFTNEERNDIIKNAPMSALVAWQDICLAHYNLLKETGRLDKEIISQTAVDEKTKASLAKTILAPAKKFGNFGKK
jgi:hypothetical protein